MRKLISLIVPVFNEEDTVGIFLESIRRIFTDINYDFEIIFIDDGSRDGTYAKLVDEQKMDPQIKIISFSRNFGKELAMAAGFEAARGDAVIPIDVDLQDPPELIREFIAKWENGYDVVIGVRKQRLIDTYLKRKSADLFYSLFNQLCEKRLVPNAGDYRLMNRAALDALISLPERVRFTKGLYAWIGFKQAIVTYNRPGRIAGSSKFNTWKLWNFALDGLFSFSTLPLRIWSYVGMIVALFGFSYAVYLIIRTIFVGVDVPGYASIMVVTLILNGVILISLGVTGEYIGRIYQESKGRPLYIVRDKVGFEDEKI